MKTTLGMLVLAMVAFAGNDASACGSHGCGGGTSVNVNVRVAVNVGGGYGYGGGCGGWGGGCGGWGGGCGGWGGGCGSFGPWFGPRPFFGRGGVAFRRSFRLQRRAQRAAAFGFFGRAQNLQARSDAAFSRGLFRAGVAQPRMF